LVECILSYNLWRMGSILRAADIARPSNFLGPQASIGQAAELIRTSGFPEAIMRDGSSFLLIDEADLAPFSLQPDAERILARDVPARLVYPVGAESSLENALQALIGQDALALPVQTGRGEILGMIRRADVVAALTGEIRPQSIGGLATPFGVSLVAGQLRGGVGNWGFVAAGVLMGLMFLTATYLTRFLAGLIETYTSLPALSAMQSDPIMPIIPIFNLNRVDALAYLMHGISFFLFFGIFRLTPMAGYHAAEHMAVHAVERMVPLEVESVARMPRVHPRCGTNLITALVGFALASRLLTGSVNRELLFTDMLFPIVVLVIVLGWREIGGLFQKYFTTRPPKVSQLEAGIQAAEELLANYRRNPHLGHPAADPFPRLLWTRGFLQTMAGMSLTVALVEIGGALLGGESLMWF
jgi:CBS domain-containing protein